MDAFEHYGGMPQKPLYDYVKAAALGEPKQDKAIIFYNTEFLACGSHYGFVPWACKLYQKQSMIRQARDFGRAHPAGFRHTTPASCHACCRCRS